MDDLAVISWGVIGLLAGCIGSKKSGGYVFTALPQDLFTVLLLISGQCCILVKALL